MVSRDTEEVDLAGLGDQWDIGCARERGSKKIPKFPTYNTLKDGPSCLRLSLIQKEEQVSEGRHIKFSSDMFWFQGQSNECDFKVLILSYQASEKEKKGISNTFMKFDIVFKYSRPKKIATWSKNFSKCTKLIPDRGVSYDYSYCKHCHTSLLRWIRETLVNCELFGRFLGTYQKD